MIICTCVCVQYAHALYLLVCECACMWESVRDPVFPHTLDHSISRSPAMNQAVQGGQNLLLMTALTTGRDSALDRPNIAISTPRPPPAPAKRLPPHTHSRTHTHTYTHTHARTHARTHAHTHTHTHIQHGTQ